MRRHAVVLAIGLLVAAGRTSPATAQEALTPRHCFESGPLRRCKTFWLTEFGGGLRFASNDLEARSSLFQWNLGFMRNVNNQAALGGSVFLTWSESNVRSYRGNDASSRP